MVRRAVGASKPLKDSAYVQVAGSLVPAFLSDLALAEGQCFSTESVVQCPQAGPNIVCQDCAMRELGENWENFKARTNAGTPKGTFYARLNREQAAPDPAFRRQHEWWKARRSI